MNKIDLIIENIEYAKLVTEQAHKDELLDEALAAARELQALKPVAWLWKDGTVTTDPDRADGTWAKLYALDELKAELAKPEPSKLCKCIDEFWCATFDRCKRNE